MWWKGGGKGGKAGSAKTNLVSAPFDLPSLPKSPESIVTRGMGFPILLLMDYFPVFHLTSILMEFRDLTRLHWFDFSSSKQVS
jgi:hypothetical protein